MMTKAQVLQILNQLPDEFEAEELIERLLLFERVEEGIRQSVNGETLTEAEARNYLSRWLPSAAVAV